jgi:hypothetical protein
METEGCLVEHKSLGSSVRIFDPNIVNNIFFVIIICFVFWDRSHYVAQTGHKLMILLS